MGSSEGGAKPWHLLISTAGGRMRYTKAAAGRQFAKWSAGYDRSLLQWLLFVPSHYCLLERLGPGGGFDLLDVGCGTGIFLDRVKTAYPLARVTGVDYSRSMLEFAAGRLSGGQRDSGTAGRTPGLVQGDSEFLPFEDDSFDVITCAHSFHHYPHQEDVVGELYRVLRPGGRLMLIDGFRDGWWGWLIYDVCVVAVEGEVRHASAERFRELLAQAGFVAIRQWVSGRLAPFLLTQAVAGKATLGQPLLTQAQVA